MPLESLQAEEGDLLLLLQLVSGDSLISADHTENVNKAGKPQRKEIKTKHKFSNESDLETKQSSTHSRPVDIYLLCRIQSLPQPNFLQVC